MTIKINDESRDGERIKTLQEKDVGCFTLQQADVPLALKKLAKKQRRDPDSVTGRTRNSRLTPITETEENELGLFFLNDKDFIFIDETIQDAADFFRNETVMCRSDGTSSRLGFRSDEGDYEEDYDDEDVEVERRDTPTIFLGRGGTEKVLEVNQDEFSEELYLSEAVQKRSMNETVAVFNRQIVPRLNLNGKRKTGTVVSDEVQKMAKTKGNNKLLSKRPRLNDEDKVKMLEHEHKHRLMLCEMAHLSDTPRSKPMEPLNVQTVRLPSLKGSSKFSSVPNLPAVLENISKNGFRKDNDVLLSGNTNSAQLSDSNSTSPTSGRSSNNPVSDGRASENELPLTGRAMSVFYNVWEGEKHRRPLEKRDFSGEKPDSTIFRRGCHCMKKSPVTMWQKKNNFGAKLPPL